MWTEQKKEIRMFQNKIKQRKDTSLKISYLSYLINYKYFSNLK